MYNLDYFVIEIIAALMLLSIAAGIVYAVVLSFEQRTGSPRRFKNAKYKNQLGKALDDYKLSILPNSGVEYNEKHYLEKFRELSSKDCYKSVLALKDF